MNRGLWAIGWALLTIAGLSASAHGQQNVESVYAPPAPPQPDQGVNEGAMHMDVKVNYMTDYIYRGIQPVPTPNSGPNLQFDGKFSLDLGKLPHPFAGIFTNINGTDSISHFQEIRPFFGFDWDLHPFLFTAGDNTYIHPNRSYLDTGDAFWQITFDDSNLWHTEHPIFSPYIYTAYDYTKYEGWYFEAGVKHDFVFEDLGFVLTAYAHVAYVLQDRQFAAGPTLDDTGFQHYQIGLTGTYSLNSLLNFSKRYGDWSLIGYLNYTDGIDHHLSAKTEAWGGVGIGLRY
ncbi:MAG TPA: hypothetical protein VG722_00985 [Tepidisphaeraceae bacterium]|nr:hypothetical protein [Tepidisphaeraceae bacterium]